MTQDQFLAFIARLCLVVIFPFSALNKIFDYQAAMTQAALLFIFYVIATAVLFHNFWSFPFNGDDWNQNFWPFLKNFGLAGGFLYIAADARMQPLRGAFSLSPR